LREFPFDVDDVTATCPFGGHLSLLAAGDANSAARFLVFTAGIGTNRLSHLRTKFQADYASNTF
tara:strand:- start:357 stop:548 length:192 start_codon:yes stop_codon:yes gene_type:complete